MKIPLDWSSDDNAWMAVLSRWGESGQAGKRGENTDPKEPIMTLSFSGGREPQWYVYPLNQTYPTTNWGQGLPEDTWWHLAVVNDGKHTVLYVEGCPTVDNATLVHVQRHHPARPAVGARRLRIRRRDQPGLPRLGRRRPHREPAAAGQRVHALPLTATPVQEPRLFSTVSGGWNAAGDRACSTTVLANN